MKNSNELLNDVLRWWKISGITWDDPNSVNPFTEIEDYLSNDGDSIERLSHYISSDPEEAFKALMAEEDTEKLASEVILSDGEPLLIWEPLESERYTVGELLDLIGM